MQHWGKDVLFTRRGLIAGAAGLIVARAAYADLLATPSQTFGPFYPGVIPPEADYDLTRREGHDGTAQGEAIEVAGRVLSVKGDGLADAVVEIWQADSNGCYRHVRDTGPNGPRDADFQGYGAVRVGPDGAYRFRTVRPRHYGVGRFVRTPHIHFRVIGAGGGELVTQMYFPGEALNEQDFLLQSLASDAARASVTARREAASVPRYLFDLVVA